MSDAQVDERGSKCRCRFRDGVQVRNALFERTGFNEMQRLLICKANIVFDGLLFGNRESNLIEYLEARIGPRRLSRRRRT